MYRVPIGVARLDDAKIKTFRVLLYTQTIYICAYDDDVDDERNKTLEIHF